MLVKLKEGESITVGMNFDKSEKPLMYTIIMREGHLMLREFGERSECDFQWTKEEKDLINHTEKSMIELIDDEIDKISNMDTSLGYGDIGALLSRPLINIKSEIRRYFKA